MTTLVGFAVMFGIILILALYVWLWEKGVIQVILFVVGIAGGLVLAVYAIYDLATNIGEYVMSL